MNSSWMEVFSTQGILGFTDLVTRCYASNAANSVCRNRQIWPMQTSKIWSRRRCGLEENFRCRNLFKIFCGGDMFSKCSADSLVPAFGGYRAHLRENVSLNLAQVKKRFSLMLVHGTNGRLSNKLRPYDDEILDLELEIFLLMQESGRPDTFPTKNDLIAAGRTDLARAIIAEGGWLAAGWEDVENTFDLSERNWTSGSTINCGEPRDSRSRSSGKPNVGKRRRPKGSKKTSRPSMIRDELPPEVAERRNERGSADFSNGKIGGMSGDLSSEQFQEIERLEPKSFVLEGESKINGLNSSRRGVEQDLQAMDDMGSVFSFLGDLKLKRHPSSRKLGGPRQSSASSHSPDLESATEAIGTTVSQEILSMNNMENCDAVSMLTERILSGDKTLDVQGCGDCNAGPVTKSMKKTRRRKKGSKKIAEVSRSEKNGSLDWISEIIHQREKSMLESTPSSIERLSVSSSVVDPKFMQDRIHAVESSLLTTREALQSGREALWLIGEDHSEALAELVRSEDALEFREDAISQARTELNTTRAQMTALEGSLNLEIMEARKALEEKISRTEKATTILKSLRTARIVWPNAAQEVFLMGSFDGWNKKIKMDKCSAGVFVVSLPLYPGRYEIKFIVDGSWRLDTGRLIAYVGGHENNVIVVS